MHDEPEVIRHPDEMSARAAEWTRAGREVGFVPTMGALHAGHRSLIRRAREECDVVVVSVFVNPIQFGEGEDRDLYPRDLEDDVRQCAQDGVDVVFVPGAADMYAEGHSTFVELGALSQHLCGLSRPSHFRGVTTVVTKLFNIVRPTRAYFGRKDAQQFLIILRMVRDLNFPVEIVACPIVREDDGLALSSRNALLKPAERVDASALHEALETVRERYEQGERDALALLEALAEIVILAPSAQLDYAAIVDMETLEDVSRVEGPVLVAIAAWFGSTRLIDNVILGVDA